MFSYIYISYKKLKKDGDDYTPAMIIIRSHSSAEKVNLNYFGMKKLQKSLKLPEGFKTKKRLWFKTDKDYLKNIKERMFLSCNKSIIGDELYFIASIGETIRIIEQFL